MTVSEIRIETIFHSPGRGHNWPMVEYLPIVTTTDIDRWPHRNLQLLLLLLLLLLALLDDDVDATGHDDGCFGCGNGRSLIRENKTILHCGGHCRNSRCVSRVSEPPMISFDDESVSSSLGLRKCGDVIEQRYQ